MILYKNRNNKRTLLITNDINDMITSSSTENNIIVLLFCDYIKKECHIKKMINELLSKKLKFIILAGNNVEYGHAYIDCVVESEAVFIPTITMHSEHFDDIAYFFLNSCYLDEEKYKCIAFVDFELCESDSFFFALTKQDLPSLEI